LVSEASRYHRSAQSSLHHPDSQACQTSIYLIPLSREIWLWGKQDFRIRRSSRA